LENTTRKRSDRPPLEGLRHVFETTVCDIRQADLAAKKKLQYRTPIVQRGRARLTVPHLPAARYHRNTEIRRGKRSKLEAKTTVLDRRHVIK
jgi:hypothetical protein